MEFVPQIRAGGVEQRRLCGSDFYQTGDGGGGEELVVGNENGLPWDVVFSSDSAGSTRGFKVLAEQVECSGDVFWRLAVLTFKMVANYGSV